VQPLLLVWGVIDRTDGALNLRVRGAHSLPPLLKRPRARQWR
jgi:hypothetical protein